MRAPRSSLFLLPLLAILATPAAARPETEAAAAIAKAKSRLAVAGSLGVDREVPTMFGDAAAALRSAESDLRNGDRDGSLSNALLAQQLTETAIEVTRPARARAVAEEQARADIAVQARIVALRRMAMSSSTARAPAVDVDYSMR